jgi:hypothetical protein
VVIHNFDVERALHCPHEANPPLGVDPDAVLPSAIADEGLKAVAWWGPQKIQRHSSIQHRQLPFSHRLDRSEITGLPSLEQRLGFIASKRLDSHQIDLIDIGVNFIPFTGKRQRIRSSTRTGRTQKLTRSQITLTERLRQFPPHVGPNLAWRGRPSIQCDLGVPWQADECAVCLNTAPGFEEPLSPEIDLPHQPLKACRFLNLQAFPLLIHALPTPQGA